MVEFIDELHHIDAMAEEGGFLSMWPDSAGARGAVLATRWSQWNRTIHTLLMMTKDRGLAMVDLQRRQVFDPRERVDVDVQTANGTRLPYLNEQIVRDVMAQQEYYGDYLIVERSADIYAQSLYEQGEDCQFEYRAGSPDLHFQTMTTDRDLVPRLFAAWLENGPAADLLQAQDWRRLEL